MNKTFKVEMRNGTVRLDKFLCGKLKNLSRNQIKGMLNSGRVIVNGRKVVIAGWGLGLGDRVEIRNETRHPSKDTRGTKKHGPARPEFKKTKRLHVKVYHQDRDIIVVDKPAGILSVPNDKDFRGESFLSSVVSYLREKYKRASGSFVSPVHRLDTETSGVMVFALSKVGMQLENQFKKHSVQRNYTALVMGNVVKDDGVVRKSLEKGDFSGGRKVRTSKGPDAVEAVTEYRVLERYKNATLLEIRVRTGRTHQIRVHMASEGHPVVGDKLYGDEFIATQKQIEFHRQALHASLLGFTHPATGQKMIFKSPLPKDIQRLVDKLRD